MPTASLGKATGVARARGLPYLLAFQVLLPLLAPLIDVAALYSLVFAPTPEIAYVWGPSWPCKSSAPSTPSVWITSRSGPCGACLCSSSSTGS